MKMSKLFGEKRPDAPFCHRLRPLTFSPATLATSSQNSVSGIRENVLLQSMLPWLSLDKISAFFSHNVTAAVGAVAANKAMPRPRLAVKTRENMEDARMLCMIILWLVVKSFVKSLPWKEYIATKWNLLLWLRRSMTTRLIYCEAFERESGFGKRNLFQIARAAHKIIYGPRPNGPLG